MIDSRLEIVTLAAPPPGTSQTASASTMMITMLRMCVLRSGPRAEDSAAERLRRA